jgi:GNAT superfamily N-acetyltransferase
MGGGTSDQLASIDVGPCMKPPPSEIEYRELRRADLPSYEKVLYQGLGTLEHAIGLERSVVTMIQSLRGRGFWTLFVLLRWLGVPIIRIFVAVERGQVLGTASLLWLRKTGVVLGVATDAAARGRGIATHLLAGMPALAQRKGRAWLALDVAAENATAIRVYQRLGYTESRRYAWYVGPPPELALASEETPTELTGPKLRTAAIWVNDQQDAEIRPLFPVTEKSFSHLEVIFQVPRTQVKSWELSASGEPTGVVRAYYSPLTETGFVLPAAWSPTLSAGSLQSLVTPAIQWIRSLGAARLVLVLPEPSPSWEPVLANFGLTKSEVSILMVRSATA